MQSELSHLQVGCCELRPAWFWCSSIRLSVFLHPWSWVRTFLVLMFLDRLRRYPLTAASQLGDERRASVRPPFLGPYLCGASIAVPKEAACLFRVLLDDAVSSGQHQKTNILNRLHAGLKLRPPVTFSPSLQSLEVLVASRTWTCHLSLRNEVFRWGEVCAVLAPPFTPVVHVMA